MCTFQLELNCALDDHRDLIRLNININSWLICQPPPHCWCGVFSGFFMPNITKIGWVFRQIVSADLTLWHGASGRPNRFITEKWNHLSVAPSRAINCWPTTASFVTMATDRRGDLYYTAGVERQCVRSAIFFRSAIVFISEFFWRRFGLLSKFFDLLWYCLLYTSDAADE